MQSLSVIVPVYNCEKYINKMLFSLSRQTFKDFEVIILDSGSTDSTTKIIKKYCCRFSNWHLFKLRNIKLGKLRNLGLILACSKYVSFIDADDYVEPEFLENLFKKICLHDADMVVCNYKFYFSKFKFCVPNIFHLFNMKSGIYDSEKIFKNLIMDVRLRSYLWNKIFKRDLFFESNAIFPDICYEDFAVMPKIFFFSDKIFIENKFLYNYNRHTGSCTGGRLNEDRIDDYITAVKTMENFLKVQKCFEKYKVQINFIRFRYSIRLVYFFSRQMLSKFDFLNNVNRFKIMLKKLYS
ncbi:MAG: glycosyltransferase group 2 family protein [Candidatus Improbicoccus pseudotrichonymphae]|uniref:Glycosyltransferase group 2 family protein n=1 Tax=Candidatus Improbicoccus pseudotrichonymphae TaxID=3033792 RepID=A0AA48KVH6_9FIRM|nr:MAG: glycosyltransferase group 2 family protein [Candidatus Improbicoccus pseudotrichonymphae]